MKLWQEALILRISLLLSMLCLREECKHLQRFIRHDEFE